MKENEPSTTKFTRETALSAIDTLLTDGGTFKSKSKVTFHEVKFEYPVDFATPPMVQVDVKTQDIRKKGSSLAASTKYAQDYVTDTLSTSAVSVKKLILNGNESSKTNDFTTFNDFRGGDILVKTVEDTEEYDHYAASCEFVKHMVGGLNMFDLFDMKFLDYKLSNSSPWKMSGNFVSRTDCPKAYKHILRDIDGISQQTEMINEIGIPYYQADDGHKIVMYSENSKKNLDELFTDTGIAWYYVIDKTLGHEGIYLPRSIYNFNITSTLADAGQYISPSLPSHTHTVSFGYGPDGNHGGTVHHGSGGCGSVTVRTGAPGGIYTGKTVQPPATKVFLYFYCN
jgi:hypothetical protein